MSAADELSHYMSSCSRLKGELKEALHHWKACEEGWNKSIKQAEDFLRERDTLQRRINPFLKRLIAATKPYWLGDKDTPNAKELLFYIYEDTIMINALIKGELDDTS